MVILLLQLSFQMKVFPSCHLSLSSYSLYSFDFSASSRFQLIELMTSKTISQFYTTFLSSRTHFQITQWSSSPRHATNTSNLTHLKWHSLLLPSYSTSSNSIRPSSPQKAPSFMFTPNSAINPGTTSHWCYVLKSSHTCPIFSIPTASAWIHPQKPPN